MPERHLNLIYRLDGDVAEIDVFKLAPTLLALGELIQQSNRELSPEGPQIAVNVKPFREGSFVVDLALFADSNLQQLIHFLTPHSLEQLKTLLEDIGLIIGLPVGAVRAIRYLRSQPKKVEEVAPGEYRYTTVDDKSITVTGRVNKLLQNPTIVNNIYKIYGVPLEELPNVSGVKTYLEGDEKTEVAIRRDEVPAIREFANPSALPDDLAETIKETLHKDVYVNPKRGSFDGDPRDWSFRRGDEIITATIKDEEFLKRCINGEYRLNFTDLLTVDLLERQRLIGTRVLKPVYEIVRVSDYIVGAQQQKLDLR